MSVNFNALTTEQEEFLISFIKHRGDIDEVVKDVSIPVTGYMSERYAANLMWLDIQKTLGIPNENYKYFTPDWPYTTKKKPKASDIVRAYYYADCLNYNERDHFAYSPVLRINLAGYDYRCYKDHIMCKKRLSYNECEDMTEEYRYDVLDLITNTLIEHMGTCQKGSQTGKNAYAVGTIAYCYKMTEQPEKADSYFKP